MRYTTVGQPSSRRRDLVIAVALAAVAVVLSAGLDAAGEMALIRTLRATVLRPFIATHEVFESRAGLASAVVELETRADSLARRVLEAADLEEENRRLRALLGLPTRDPGDFFVVELVHGRTPAGEPSGFQLRAPDAPGFRTPLAVAAPDGLLGVVRTARGGVGMGEYWSHPDFRVAAITADGSTGGIVRPFVDEHGAELMLLEGVPFQTDIAEGTPIVTSGVGGIYPRGLRVGTVLAEHEQQLGWTHSYLVEPAVRPGRQSIVLAWRPGSVADSLVPPPPSAGDSGRDEELGPRGGVP